MSSLFGFEASRAVLYVVAFAIILVLVALFGLVLRKLTGGRLMIPGHDRGRSRQPRLGIVDIYDLDRQRQLVLLRRDNVEHLLLIGGLNDVVIETNIVRVSGARIPAPPAETGAERYEPAVDPMPRPQVEPGGRPSIETQLAAQLGAFIRRPSEESDAEEELAPVASLTAPAAARPDAVLKPDHVTVTAMPTVEPVESEARRPAFLRSPATPEAPPVRPEPRPTGFGAGLGFQSRPTPTAPPVQPASPPAEIVRAPEQDATEAKSPDAHILSDMAKQLEEALKQPAQPVAPPPALRPVAPPPPPAPVVADEADEDEDELLVPPAAEEKEPAFGPARQEPVPPVPPVPPVLPTPPAPEPVRPAAPTPHPVPPPPPPAPAAAAKVSDPFSVEEIEAEFARLLGRPRDTGSKS